MHGATGVCMPDWSRERRRHRIRQIVYPEGMVKGNGHLDRSPRVFAASVIPGNVDARLLKTQ